VYQDEQRQIVFAKRCKKFGVKSLQTPVAERIGIACDKYDNVFVLYDGDCQDDKKRWRYHSAFIELAKNSRFVSDTACYVAWIDKKDKDHTNNNAVYRS